MAIVTTHQIVGVLADGTKICKTTRTGGGGCSGGIYINVPLTVATSVLGFHLTSGHRASTVLEFNPAVTSGNEVFITVNQFNTTATTEASGGVWGAPNSGESTTIGFVMYTLGV